MKAWQKTWYFLSFLPTKQNFTDRIDDKGNVVMDSKTKLMDKSASFYSHRQQKNLH